MKSIFTVWCMMVLVVMSAFCQTEAFFINEDFQDRSIEEVLEVLREKYDLQIAYNYEAVAGIRIHQKIDNLVVGEALQKIFSTTDLEYQLKDKQLLIRKNTAEKTIPTLPTYSIQGKVIDDKTGKPLEFATIFSKVDKKGNAADVEGRFNIQLQTDKKAGELVVQYLGYIPRTIVWKAKDDLSNLVIRLQSKSIEFEGVIITEKIPTISTKKEAGAITLNASQLNTLPSFVGGKDIMRSLQLLPGIAADDDLSAELRIRGGTGDESMVIMDGITLYKVDHYFGVFSAVNSSMVDQVSVYKNAFPVEYGGRTSGVVAFSTAESNRSTLNGGLEVNLLTSNAYLEIPLGKRMNILVGGRLTNKNIADTDLFSVLDQKQRAPNTNNTQNYSTNGGNNPPPPPNNISRNSLLAYEPNFKFNDFNIKWAWNITPTTRLAAHYFQGYDEFAYDYTQEFIVGAPDKRQTAHTETYAETANWRNKGASLIAKQEWSSNLSSDVTLSYSGYQEDRNINSFNASVELKRRPPRPGESNTIEGTEDTTTLSNQNYKEIKGLELNWKNNWQINKQQEIAFGYNVVKNDVVLDLILDKQSILTGGSLSATQHAFYAQYMLRAFEDKFRVGVGLRSTYYSLTQKNYWSPRINLSYQLSDHLQLKGAWSRYNQFLRRHYYEDRFSRSYEFWVLADDERFPVATATNWMGGFNWFHDFMEVDVEFYYKTTNNILEFSQSILGNGFTGNAERYEIFVGDRVSKGIDVLLKKNMRQYTTWFAYTLSKTTNNFKAIDKGTPYPSRDDRRHQIKWVHQYAYKNFDFSATYCFSSGKPYTDLSKLEEQKDRKKTKPEDLISYLENYQRVDIGAAYNFQWKQTKGTIGLSIFNVLNRKNVKYRQYILSVAELEDDQPGGGPRPKPMNTILGTELQLLDFTPNLSFSLKF